MKLEEFFNVPEDCQVELLLGRSDLQAAGCPCGEHHEYVQYPEVPVLIQVRNPDGSYAGTAAHPGYLFKIHLECLEELEGGPELIQRWKELECNVGTHWDPREQAPVCLDCLLAAGEDFEDPENPGFDRQGEEPDFRLLREDKGLCWSCVEGLTEVIL